MNRLEMLNRAVSRNEPWDMLIIGGGATGAGIAVDAAARGYGVLLVEQSDFAKATSSRSTKLVHGGVRYLKQGHLGLVREALHERHLLRQNAPHLVHDCPFIVPCYRSWEVPFYGIGMKVYDLLAGRFGFGSSQVLSRARTLTLLPTVKTSHLRGGVLYHDGQFDDSRMAIDLVVTAAEQGAVVLNYAAVTDLSVDGGGRINGATVQDRESGDRFDVRARVVVNAAGAFCDKMRRLIHPEAEPLVAPSQGIHLVFNRSFLPGNTALLAPQTDEGRVLFVIPWHGHCLVGTTDTPIAEVSLEPTPLEQEIDFVLRTAGRYLERPPVRRDILSVFVGIRPLVRGKEGRKTASLPRDHKIHVDPSHLLTIVGGKWTTYRKMAEDCVNRALQLTRLPQRACVTRALNIHGWHHHSAAFGPLAMYGTDAPAILKLMSADPALQQPLHAELPYAGAEVVWAARHEMARTVEDILARRTRALFLNARAALAMAPQVANLLAAELQRDDAWCAEEVKRFAEVAKTYVE